ncbi:MAG: hypothetical protein D6765_15960 [Bacteroidetes bacterium]|nr:MAG: hypothetical protein D6765_15960 [Bacteroidota bacterium]
MQTEDKILENLRVELKKYEAILSRAADTILDQEVSSYPIFVFHRGGPQLGVPLIEAQQSHTHWSVNASTLEEFATRQLIRNDRVEDFQRIYKDPRTHFCIFLLEADNAARFVFLPRN